MADVNASINIDINASSALAQLRALESQISNFNNSVARSNAAAMQVQRGMISSLQAQIEATGNFNTSIRTMEGNLSSLSTAFDKGTLSARQYFRYAASQMPGLANAFRGLGKEQAEMAALAENRVKQLQTRYVSLGRDINGMQRMLAIQPKTLAAGYATDIALAEQKQQLFNRSLQLGSTGLVNWGKNTQWAGRQLMVGFTVPLTIAAGAAAKFFMDLDKAGVAFRRVYGDMGTSTAETEKNLEAIQKLGEEYTKYGLAVNEVIDLGSRAAATGAMNEDLLAATEQTLRLATLGQTDYNTALDATISFQTAFQLNSQELAETINFLNAVENQTILTMEDMARAVPRVAPVIKGLGGDVSDLAVFMTALREGGVTAEQGANALKSGLASLINPTERASETLKEMGINIKAIVDANRGDLMGTVKAFGEALSTLGEFERQQALEATFGKYQYARLGALFKNIARDGSQAARSMDLAGMAVEDLASLADKELATVSESVTNKFLGAVERLKVAIAPIGEMFLQAMTPIIEVVTNIANKFNELPDTVKTVIAGVVGAVGLIAPAVLMGIGLIANGIGNGLKFILALRGGIRNLVGVLTGSTQSFQYQSSAALDAAAAMNALDGSSGALTSSLLMQEGAVNSLIGAYGNLAGAARAAASSMPRAFPAPVMAGGARIIRRAMGGVIPGTGNTDSVPALLTPGEFVMTKEATQQFGPILSAMNAGATQGFQNGGEVTQAGRSRASRLEFAHIADKFEMTTEDISRMMRNLEEMGASSSKAYRELERASRASEKVYGYTNLGVPLRGDVNALLGGAGAARGQVSGAIRQSGAGAASGILDVLAQRGIVIDDADAQRFANEFSRSFADEIDRLPDEMLKDRNLTQPFRTAVQNAGTTISKDFSNTAARIIDEEMQNITTIVTETGQKHGGTGRASVPTGRVKGRVSSYLSRGRTRSSIFSRLMGGRSMQQVATEGVATGAATASPSDATRAVGKDVGEGLVQGMNESAGEVRAAGENMGRVATGGVADAAKQGQLELFDEALSPNLAQDEQLALFNEKDLAAANKDAVDERKKSNFAIRQNTDATQKHTLQVKESTASDALNERATRKNTNLQVTKTQAGAIMRPSIATSGSFTPAGATVDNESAALAAALTDQETETSAATKQTRGLKDRIRGLSGKLFGASAAFTGLTIAGSFMEGQIGQVASSLMPVAFGMDAVAGLLPMMMNPMGITIAALAAVGGGLWFLNEKSKEVSEKSKMLADSMSVSASTIKSAADFFGNQIRGQKEKISDFTETAEITDKELAQATEFLSTDMGTKLSESFSQGLQEFGMDSAVQNLANNLASMILQGALSPDQAKSISAAIAQQLGMEEISFKVIGRLSKLIGPDGKDVLKNPVRVALEIDKQQLDLAKQTFDDLESMAKITIPVEGGGATSFGGSLQDVQFLSDIARNIDMFTNPQFEALIGQARTLGGLIGNDMSNAYANLNAATEIYNQNLEKAQAIENPERRKRVLERLKEEKQLIDDQKEAIKQRSAESLAEFQKYEQYPGLQREMLRGVQQTLTDTYAGTAFEGNIEKIKQDLSSIENVDLQWEIQVALASQEINPAALSKIMDLMGGAKIAAPRVQLLFETAGLDVADQILTQLALLDSEELSKRISLDITGLSPADLDDVNQGLSLINSLPPEITKALKVEDFGIFDVMRFGNEYQRLIDLPTPVTKKAILQALGEEEGRALIATWSSFNSLPDSITKTARYVSIQEYWTIYRQIGFGPGGAPVQGPGLGHQGDLVVDGQYVFPDNLQPPGGGASTPTPTPIDNGGGGGGGGGGDSEKSPAELVEDMIKDLKQQLKFLGDYKKVGDEVKSGLAQALRNAGAPEQLIADIISKGAEGIKIAKELLKDKAKKLKEVTDLMLEVTRLTFVESQRAEAANLATQTSAQMALANAGLNPAVIANMDSEQAQAVAAAYRAYQAAQRKADAAEDKGREKRKQANKELANARKEWEMVTNAVNKNTSAQERNAIAQALLTAQQERQDAQNRVSAALALAGRGMSAEQIGGMLEIEGAANQITAYTDKIKQLEAERKKLEDKGRKKWTDEERKRYQQLGRQLKKVNGDYRELLALLNKITKEQARGAIANATIGFAGQTASARRQGAAQNILMGQGYTYDQASSIAGDEEGATAITEAQKAVEQGESKVNRLIKERSKYKVGSEKYKELSAKIKEARAELNQAKTAQDNLNASIAQSVTEQQKLDWQSIQEGLNAEIAKQANSQKFLNMGINDQLILGKLNGLTLEQQNYFLSLSVEEQNTFLALLQQSITAAEKIAQSFEEIANRQRLISLQNEERANKEKGNRDALEESAQLIDDAARAKQREIDAVQETIDVYQELNDDLQHQVSLYERQIELIQRQNDQFNRGLEIISQEEEKINEFYDERLEALDKVQQANDRITQQQQDQLNLAQALSTGDIFAAAGAAQQMRANQAQFAADKARETLEEAREKALEDITVSVNGQLMKRKDIEEQIKKNEEQIYQLNQLMLPLQDQIYANNLEIYRIQDSILEPLQAQLDLINKQREAVDDSIRAWDRYYKYLEENAVDPVTGIKFKDLSAIREAFEARMQPGVTNVSTGQAYTEEEAFAEATAGRNLTPETLARLKTVLFREDASEVISPENAEAAGEAANKATPEVTKLKDEFVKVKDAIVALVNPIKNSGKEVDRVVKDSITPLQESFKNAGNIVEGNNDSLLQKITNIKDFVVNSLIPEFSNLIVELNGATLAAQALQSALNAIERNINVTVTTQYVSAGAPQGAYKGGMIKGYAMGGSVFGSGSRDSVAAMLTPGEFVVRKSMVDKYGVPMLNKLNQGSLSPSYSVPNGNVNYRANTSNKSTVTTVAPVYNTYSVQINAETNASADEIANKAAMKIREMNNMSLRSARG